MNTDQARHEIGDRGPQFREVDTGQAVSLPPRGTGEPSKCHQSCYFDIFCNVIGVSRKRNKTEG